MRDPDCLSPDSGKGPQCVVSTLAESSPFIDQTVCVNYFDLNGQNGLGCRIPVPPQVWKEEGWPQKEDLTKPTHPVTQRLFWLLRVVTSLFIGAVILGECQAQLTWATASVP